jgi:hypothetical protein
MRADHLNENDGLNQAIGVVGDAIQQIKPIITSLGSQVSGS